MKSFLKIFKAFYKQFLLLQALNIAMLVILRISVDKNMYTSVLGSTVTVILLFSLISYEYNTFPIRFKEIFKALFIGYLFYDIVFVIGYLSYGFNNINDGLLMFGLFHLFTIYSYLFFFSKFRSKESVFLFNLVEKPTKDELTTRDNIKNMFRLVVIIICVSILKNSFIGVELNNNSVRDIILVILVIVIMINLKVIISPIKNTYNKLVENVD